MIVSPENPIGTHFPKFKVNWGVNALPYCYKIDSFSVTVTLIRERKSKTVTVAGSQTATEIIFDNFPVSADFRPGVIGANVKATGTARIIGSAKHETQLNFSSSRAEASGQIKLFDKACGTSCVTHQEVYNGLTNSQATNISVIGPNAVKDITFPDGNSVTVGGLLTIQINLVRPAKSGVISKSGIRIPGGEIVHWQLVPSNVFEAASGSGASFSPTGLNQVRIPGGDTLVRLTVRLKEAPSGCLRTGCSADVQTRMGNINTDQPPFFKMER